MLCSFNSIANERPLPADQAFVFSATVTKSNEVLVEWKIAPGYYLYRQRLNISLDPKVIADYNLPKGDLKKDLSQGHYEVYANHLVIPVLLKTNDQKIQLNVDYQGCSQYRFCYPPIHKSITLDLSALSSSPSYQNLLTDQHGVSNLLQTQHLFITFFIFMGLGLLLAFTPCVLPMIPILTGIIVGQKETMSTKKAFFLSLSYVLGSALTYAMVGVIAAALGSSLQVLFQKPWIILSVSSLFILLALSLFGLYELRLPTKLHLYFLGMSQRQRAGNYVGVFCMGVLSTLIVSPCVTAPLAGVLIYISQTGNLLLGAIALFALGLGMGVPLLIIGMSAGKWLPKSGAWMDAVKIVFGFMMIGMAIWLLSRIVMPFVAAMIWGLFLISIGMYLIIYLPKLIGRKRINQILGVMVVISGIIIMVSGIVPTRWRELTPHQHVELGVHQFIDVTNIADLKKQLAIAKNNQQPVIVDFYADWCESCVSMEKNVFQSADVQKYLSGFVLLRANVTNNTADEEALLKDYQVIAPPTVLFFNAQGKELYSQRIIGEVNSTEFLAKLVMVEKANTQKDNNER